MSKKQSNPQPPLASPPNPPPPPLTTPLTENHSELETAEGRLELSKAAAHIAAREGELFLYLRRYPELRDKLLEALATDHFMVTIHCQKVIPGREGDLQHWIVINPNPAGYIITNNYMPGDVELSLAKIGVVHCEKIMELLQDLGARQKAKDNPTADTKKVKGWI